MDTFDSDQDLFINAFNYAAIGMALVATDGTWLRVNAALCAIVGYSPTELMSRTFQDITHPEDLDEDLGHVKAMLEGSIDTYQMQKRYFHKSGHIIHVLLSVSLVKNSDGSPRFFISQIQDISGQKRLEEELIRIAEEDYLTGVSNRRYFLERASRELERGDRFGEPQTLLMLDIDHFKKINDTYGHATGDEVLKEMARVCRSSLRSFDLFGRLGGEEFGALLINTDSAIAYIIAERLRKKLSATAIQTEKGTISFTVSIGMVSFTGGDKTVEHRLNQADVALYKAKGNGRNKTECICEESNFCTATEHFRTSFVQLVWKPEYECANSTINRQHMELFTIANQLLSACISGLPDEDIEAIACELAASTTRHFHDEIGIIMSTDFPWAREHDRLHSTLIDRMSRMIESFRKGEIAVGQLFEFLAIKVVSEHMLHEDRKFFPYLEDAVQDLS